MCIFEQIYFSRPDSVIDGQLTYESRMKMGMSLAKEHAVDADIVVGVPDSAIPAAIGYSNESKIKSDVSFTLFKFFLFAIHIHVIYHIL